MRHAGNIFVCLLFAQNYLHSSRHVPVFRFCDRDKTPQAKATWKEGSYVVYSAPSVFTVNMAGLRPSL